MANYFTVNGKHYEGYQQDAELDYENRSDFDYKQTFEDFVAESYTPFDIAQHTKAIQEKIFTGTGIELTPLTENEAWDNIEVSPVWDDGEGSCEVCDEGQETYWSVYLHMAEGGVRCIADCKTEDEANALAKIIGYAARNYVDNKFLEW